MNNLKLFLNLNPSEVNVILINKENKIFNKDFNFENDFHNTNKIINNLNKILNIKEFKAYKYKKPSNVRQILNISEEVRLKTIKLCIK